MTAIPLCSVRLTGYLLASVFVGVGLPSWAAADAAKILDVQVLPITEAQAEFNHGLLWRIENNSADPSYLFGTMHTEDPRVMNLPQPVLDAFERSRSLTLEALLGLDQILAAGAELLLTDGNTLADLVGPERFSRVSEQLKTRGMMPQLATLLKPWAAAVLLAQPAMKSGVFLDRKTA